MRKIWVLKFTSLSTFFSKYINFHNKYSRKMFNLKGNYTILEVSKPDDEIKNKLQGNLKVKMIKNIFYSKA